MTEIVNATSSITALSDVGSYGWIVTSIVFVGIVLTLFLIFRNIRRVIYGSVISGVLLIIFKVSRWIGVSTQEQNYSPIKWFGYIIGFIILSWIIGIILDRTKIIKKIEEKLK